MRARAGERGTQILERVLFALAACAYGAVFLQARTERSSVREWIPYAEHLGSQAIASTNVASHPEYGFADLGADFRMPLRATWTLRAIGTPAATGTYLFFTADEPLFYGANASVRIYLSGRLVGVLAARATRAPNGPFVANRAPELLLVPPVKAFGYQFAIADARETCRATCTVSVVGTLTTWRVYRVGLVTETPRFTPS